MATAFFRLKLVQTLPEPSADSPYWHYSRVFIILKLSPNQKKSPNIAVEAFLVYKPGSDLLSHGNSHTIIGDDLFHFRVRDGIGWGQVSMAARKFWFRNGVNLFAYPKFILNLATLPKSFIQNKKTFC